MTPSSRREYTDGMATEEKELGIWGRLTAKLRKSPPPLGARGEAHAAKYLRKQGYSLVVRNRREGKGEIDLIVMDKEYLVFVEVRTRTSEDFMTPEASIRADKRKTVRQTVRRLIRKHRTAGLRPRIDVIAIIWPEGAREPTELRHHKAVIPLASW
jgi:putative endonuclease